MDEVVILSTNDYHSQHESFDLSIEGGNSLNLGGSVRLANCIETEQKKCEEKGSKLIVVSVGDVFLGSEYFTFFSGEVEMKLMERCECNILAVGNHEFDQGGINNLLLQNKKTPSVELLCANVRWENGSQCFSEYKILNENGLKIGITALLGKQAWDVTPKRMKKGLVFHDMFETAKQVIRRAEEKHMAIDFWICLSHTGINLGDQELSKLGLFDIVLSGHEHFEAPVLEWKKIGSTFLHAGNSYGKGVQKCVLSKSKSIEVDTILLDEKFDGVEWDLAKNVSKMLSDYSEKMEHIAGEVVATCHSDNYSKEYIGRNFHPVAISPLTDLVLDSFFHIYKQSIHPPKLPILHENLLSLMNFGSLRGRLPRGEVQVRHTSQAMPFSEALEIICLQGRHLHRIQERNLTRAEERKKNKPPGMGYHIKWFKKEKDLLNLKPNEEFFILLTNYIRENDIAEVLEDNHNLGDDLEKAVVWDMSHLPQGHIIQETSQGLVEFLKLKKVVR